MNPFKAKQAAASADHPGSRVSDLLSTAHDLSVDRRQPERVNIDLIVPNPNQPRRHFDQVALHELASSIKERGVAVPLLLRPIDGQRYEIVFGERRYRAAQLAGLTSVPANVKSLSDQDVHYLALLENLQRENLNRLDEVEAKLAILAYEFGTDQAGVIERLNVIRAQPADHQHEREQAQAILRQFGAESVESFTTNGLSVLRLPTYLADAVRRGEVSHTHALRIAGAPPEHHAILLQATVTEDLTVKALRERIASLKPMKTPHPAATLRQMVTERNINALNVEQRAKFDGLLQQMMALIERR